MAKLVAICKLSETDIQISPLTITPPAFDKNSNAGCAKTWRAGLSMRTKSESAVRGNAASTSHRFKQQPGLSCSGGLNGQVCF